MEDSPPRMKFTDRASEKYDVETFARQKTRIFHIIMCAAASGGMEMREIKLSLKRSLLFTQAKNPLFDEVETFA